MLITWSANAPKRRRLCVRRLAGGIRTVFPNRPALWTDHLLEPPLRKPVSQPRMNQDPSSPRWRGIARQGRKWGGSGGTTVYHHLMCVFIDKQS